MTNQNSTHDLIQLTPLSAKILKLLMKLNVGK